MKQMKSGIYVIKNKVNNKVYIGQSEQIKKRWAQHRYDLRNNYARNENLQQDWNIYGQENFEFKILALVPISLLNYTECLLISEWGKENIYNSDLDEYGFTAKFRENRHSVEAREKAKISIKEHYETDWGKQRKREASIRMKERNSLVKFTPEQKRIYGKMGSDKRTENGYTHSEETKERISRGHKKEYVGAISPDGTVYAPIINMTRFCKEHNLGVSSMIGVMHGRRNTHRGWTLYQLEA